tara:strand:- start:341 stop:586 length:246 start_codon:yes stop_codon:yes gene_type:complete
MSSVDKYMIPVTIVITFLAVIPFVAPGGLFDITIDEEKPMKPKISPSQINDSNYFKGLDENVEDAKQAVRDLLAEHEAANP